MSRIGLPADRVRMWKVGGPVTVAVIFLAGWVFLLHPHRADLAEARAAGDTARASETVQVAKLNALRADFLKSDDYDSQLATNRKALPGTDALPDFLRELQAAGVASGVTVTDVGAGTPKAVSASGTDVQPGATAAAGAPVYAITVTILATGDEVTDEEFLRQLQQVQPRAVLFDTLTLAAAGDDPDGPGDALTPVTLTASLRVFVAPEAAATAPR